MSIRKVVKAKPVDRATPCIRKARNTDGAKITVTRSLSTTMQSSSLWNASPELQAAAKAWNAPSDALESNAKAIADLRGKLGTLEASQRVNRHDWSVATKQI